MLRMFERQYLFNPYMLKNCEDDELCKAINDIASQYKDSDLMPDVVFDINLEADLLTIYGEMIARLTEQSALLKLEADTLEDKETYKLRNDWVSISNEKAPAIDYFKAQAREACKDKREKQLSKEAMLTRFKRAYASLETKQNALKKKLDAFKYEGY